MRIATQSRCLWGYADKFVLFDHIFETHDGTLDAGKSLDHRRPELARHNGRCTRIKGYTDNGSFRCRGFPY